jgi:hypothetical protein
MAATEIPDELLSRLKTVAEHDYGGVTLEETLDRLLREHQEHVMLGAAGEFRERATGEGHQA